MLPARSFRFWLATSAAIVFGAGVFVSRVLGASLSLTAVSPINNQKIAGNEVTAQFAVKGLKLVKPSPSLRNAYGQGHLHLWLDQANPTKLSAIKSGSNSYTFQNVGYGQHRLMAELVNNDHSSLVPPVTTTVNFQTVPTPAVRNHQLLLISSAAFLFIVLVLYFVFYTKVTRVQKKNKSAKKFSRK